MLDLNDLLITIKKAAVEAVEASKPVAVVFGMVTHISPLEINIEQKMSLKSAQLVLTKNITDYDVTINGQTVTVKNALTVGDEVVLVRMQGGQKFIVIDKVVKT